jgi:hypothetical protein
MSVSAQANSRQHFAVTPRRTAAGRRIRAHHPFGPGCPRGDRARRPSTWVRAQTAEFKIHQESPGINPLWSDVQPTFARVGVVGLCHPTEARNDDGMPNGEWIASGSALAGSNPGAPTQQGSPVEG